LSRSMASRVQLEQFSCNYLFEYPATCNLKVDTGMWLARTTHDRFTCGQVSRDSLHARNPDADTEYEIAYGYENPAIYNMTL
jgi:hypothetical protein